MMVDRIFGDSGGTVVIEENMTGDEASIFAVCDPQVDRLSRGVLHRTQVTLDRRRAHQPH